MVPRPMEVNEHFLTKVPLHDYAWLIVAIFPRTHAALASSKAIRGSHTHFVWIFWYKSRLLEQTNQFFSSTTWTVIKDHSLESPDPYHSRSDAWQKRITQFVVLTPPNSAFKSRDCDAGNLHHFRSFVRLILPRILMLRCNRQSGQFCGGWIANWNNYAQQLTFAFWW